MKNFEFSIVLCLFIFKQISLLKLKWIIFFMSLIFKWISYIKFKRIKWCPALLPPFGVQCKPYGESDSPSLMGSDGIEKDGMGDQKCPFTFFILRYIKHYTHYVYIYIKNVLTNFFWVLNFARVGGPNKKIKNTL